MIRGRYKIGVVCMKSRAGRTKERAAHTALRKAVLCALAVGFLLVVPSSETAAQSGGSKGFSGLTQFTATDLEGRTVTQDIFMPYTLTMVNIWGTFCSPCLREMPELGEIRKEFADKGVNVIGIVIDVLNRDGSISKKQVELAADIVAKTNAAYTHLLPSDDLIRLKLRYVNAVPETFFVDSKGKIVGRIWTGARNKAAWIKIINDTLLELKK